MGEWPVAVVPNPIDTDRWQPIDQPLALQLLGLKGLPLAAVWCHGRRHSPALGLDLLLAALTPPRSEPTLHSLQLVVFGQHSPQSPPQLCFPLYYTGHLYDDLSLRALYSAADAMVIPFRQDNFPNIGLEAHACGAPVVAFNIGGMPDIVADRVTGVLDDSFRP